MTDKQHSSGRRRIALPAFLLAGEQLSSLKR
jgi:hypothetical protein